MWAIIKTFFANNTAKVLEWAAIIGSATAGVLAIFNAGKKSERVADLQKDLDGVKNANAIEDDNRKRPDGAAADELRDSWSR